MSKSVNNLIYYLLKLSTVVLLYYASNATAGVVTLVWDASSSPNVSGYRIYYGKTSGNYTYNIDIGNYTAVTIAVPEGATYYFAVKAYDSAGNTSGFSNEVRKPFIRGDLDGNGTADLVGLTSTGAIYYTTNLSTWTNIPGWLSQLAVGDLDGNGTADLVGLDANGNIYYTLNRSTWTTSPVI